MINNHFTSLFTSGGRRELSQVLDCIHPSVLEEMNEILCESFTLTEIKEAVFQIGGFKAPGPYGFQGVFFQTFWDIIGEEVNGLVEDFSTGKEIPWKLNSTHIVLIPKVGNPSLVSQI